MAKIPTEYDLQLRDIMQEAARAEGLPAVELFESAARLADLHQDIEGGMGVRIELVKAAVHASYAERAIVAFTWCLAQYDKDRQRLSGFQWKLMWYYKWVVNYVWDYAGIEMGRIEAIFADMERRYAEWGYSWRVIYNSRASMALQMGDIEGAKAWAKKWMGEPRDRSADCRACEADQLVEYLVAWGSFESIMRAAEPILSGRVKCLDVPTVTYCKLLMTLARAGRMEQAREYQASSIRKLSRVGSKYQRLAEHMRFLTADGNAEGAFRILTRTVPQVLETRSDLARLEFFIGAMIVCAGLRKGGKDQTKARLPAAIACAAGGSCDMAELERWFREEAAKLGAAFDKRNGHKGVSERLAAAECGVDG